VARAASGMTVNNATGYYNNGEVEDYRVFISGVLPVNLITFNAQAVNNNSVKLLWTTENEININSYEVQKSDDGINWNTFTSATPVNEPGQHNYTAWDYAPSKGTSYYRLKIVHNGGHADKYSAVKTVFIASEKISWQLAPNPARDQIHLFIESDKHAAAVIRFTDMSGRQVLSSKKSLTTGSNQFSFSEIQHWQAGVYFVTVISGEGIISTKKFSLIK
jgi:hypothetical protein